MSGVNFLIFYTKKFFDNVSNNGDTMNIVLGVTNILGGFLGIPLVQGFGRRFNLRTCCIGMMISMFSLAVGIYTVNRWICMAAVMSYMLHFAYGLGGTMPVFVAEIAPSNAVGIANGA